MTSSDQTHPLKAVHVGISGFPFGSAAINKCIAVYQSVALENTDFLIINNRAVHKKNVPFPLEKNGTIHNLRYTYTSPSPFKSDSFLRRRFSNVIGRLQEFFLLLRLSAGSQIDVMFYYPTNGSFFELIYYRMFSKLFGFPLVAQYVEYRTVFQENTRFEKMKHRWFDQYFMRFVDAVLPISEFLIEHIKSKGFKKAYLKVPPLTDFSLFDQARTPGHKNYFLYVGTAHYLDTIVFITKAFDQTIGSDFELHMVVNGSAQQMQEVNRVISQIKKRESVKILSNLKYSDLIDKYLHASALLIPLSDSIQDKARFPQKISEYLASGNPVITTDHGEIPYYFTDQVNGLVAKGNNINDFAVKMNYVIQHPEDARIIGQRGKETGLKYFDINSYGSSIKHLILSLPGVNSIA